MKNNIKELDRKTWYCEEDGIACGPASSTAIDAVMVVDDQGETVYLHAQWVDIAGPEIYYEASKENLLEICQKISDASDDMDELTRYVDEMNHVAKLPNDYVTNRYSEQLEELEEMIIAEAKEHDIYYLLSDEDDDEEYMEQE